MSQSDAHDEKLNPGIVWAKDVNWSKPFVVYPGSERFKAIDDHLYYKGLLAVVGGERYVFVDMLNYWCNLSAKIAMLRLCGLLGIKNATVNYPDATVGYNEHIIKRCDANEASALPTSVCIGTARFEVSIDQDKRVLTFSDSRTVIERGNKIGSVPDVVYQACIMPIRSTIYPRMYVYPGKCSLLGYIAQLFPDTRDLTTLLWHVGNSVIDPVTNPKSIMLYGPGGSGKSTVLRVVSNALGSACGLLPEGSLTTKSNGMPVAVSSVIASNRMAVCYDVQLKDYPMNMGIFKNISGSDYVRVGELTCKTNCSLTIGTNGYVDIKKQDEYTSDAIMRRLVALYMDVSAMDIPVVNEPSGADDRLDFACAAMYTRLQYEYIPVAPRSILATLCSSEYVTACELIEETHDFVLPEDATEVLCIIGRLTNVPPRAVAYKARLISKSAVYDSGEKVFIRGLRPTVH